MSYSQILNVTVIGSLPSWRPAPGVLAVVAGAGVAGTNKIEDVCPYNNPNYATLGPKFQSDSLYNQIGINWATATYSPLVGNFGAYILGSGGHATYYGNERYVWSLDDRQWRRYGPWGPGNPAVHPPGLLGVILNNENYDTTHNASGGTTPPFIYDQLNNELGGTTQILVPHEYDMRVWLPPSMGGGSAGSDMYVNEMYGHGQLSGSRAHRWDIAAGIAAGVGVSGTAPGVGWVRACSGTAFTYVGTAAVDETAKKVYACDSGFGTPQPISTFKVYDFSAGTGTSTVTEVAAPGNHFSIGGQQTSEVWYGPSGTQRLWVHFGRSTTINALETAPLIRIYDLNNLGGPYYEPPLTGPGLPALVEHLGVCWCPDLNSTAGGVFFAKDVRWANNGVMFKITPPATNPIVPVSGNLPAWTWTAEPMLDANSQPMQGDNGSGAVDMCNGWYKRLRYASKARTILINTRSDVNQRLYAWTPPGL